MTVGLVSNIDVIRKELHSNTCTDRFKIIFPANDVGYMLKCLTLPYNVVWCGLSGKT